jgi:hypothetical protein
VKNKINRLPDKSKIIPVEYMSVKTSNIFRRIM